VPEFRLYRLHPDHGHITGVDDFNARDAEAALHAVRELGYPVPVELWSGPRKIAHIAPPPHGAAFWPHPLGEASG